MAFFYSSGQLKASVKINEFIRTYRSKYNNSLIVKLINIFAGVEKRRELGSHGTS